MVFAEMPQVVADLDRPEHRCDSVFLPRAVYMSGDIDGHDLCWQGPDLVVANTRFSCLARIADRHGFEPVWQPRFVSALAPDDRCHLNGLAVTEAGMAYATAFGQTDAPDGWRDGVLGGGVVLDVASGVPIMTGLTMPHSPRVFDGEVYVLDSGTGRVLAIDPRSGQTRAVSELPGFVRGLDRLGDVLFVGLSKLRAGRRSWHLPIEAHGDRLICGVAAIKRNSGLLIGWLEFMDFEEVFDLKVVTGTQNMVFEAPFGPASARYIDLQGRVFETPRADESPQT